MKKVAIKDLPNNIMGIYKINYPNGKIYIGLSRNIKRRMWEHNNINKAKTPCDFAIAKYGKITEIELLERIDDETKLEEREAYWIKYYNSNNKDIGYNLTDGGDGSGKSGEESGAATFTNAEVLDIRKRRFEGERKKDVYKDYENHPFSSFERIWLGRGYPTIGTEYLIPAGTHSRAYYSSQANSGLKNGRAKCTREQILEIRRLYEEEHTPFVLIAEKFPHISKSSVRRIALRESYANVE